MSSGEKMAKEYYGKNYDFAMKNYKQGLKDEKAAFLKKYPNADLTKFEFDITVEKSGGISEKNIYFKLNKQDSLNITSPVFQKSSGIQWLGLSLRDRIIFNKFGDKNYTKFDTVFNTEVSKLKNNFSDRYPHANLNKFTFNVNLNSDLTVKDTSIFYQDKSSDGTSWDITSETFKNLYSDSLFWSPRIWSSRGSVQPLNMLDPQPLTFKLTRFKIYVDQSNSFISNFEKLDTVWENKNKSKNITKVKFDYKTDPYFTSLLAAYVISYESGISLKHLEYNFTTPYIITSIARYFVYYHMKRFLKYPDKLDFYVDENTISFVQKNIPTRQIWVKKLDQTQERLSIWLKKKGTVKNYHFVLGNNPVQGVYGISYQELDQVVNASDQDWIKFLKSDSDGLTTKIGQKLFQHAIESYVYCILGSQAQTHWPIVNAGAKSLQTQDIFHKLVLDTISQDNAAVAISNMRRAIKDTNVVLNMVVSPGIILIPSSLIIQKKMVSGYNNELTLATNNMKFGKNININSEANEDEKTTEPGEVKKNMNISSSFSTTKEEFHTDTNPAKKDSSTTLFGSMIIIGLLISKYLV